MFGGDSGLGRRRGHRHYRHRGDPTPAEVGQLQPDFEVARNGGGVDGGQTRGVPATATNPVAAKGAAREVGRAVTSPVHYVPGRS